MPDNIARQRRSRRICFALMALFLAVAGGKCVAGLLPIADPALSSLKVYCKLDGCWPETDPLRLVPPRSLQSGPLTDAQEAELHTLLYTPRARIFLSAAEIVRALPAVFLFLSLAFAARAVALGQGFAILIGWLRRAAISAFILVFAEQIASSLRATALSPVLLGRESIAISLSGGPFLWGILLTGAAWMAVWALEQARAAEIELAKIV